MRPLVTSTGDVHEYGPDIASGLYDPTSPTRALIEVGRGADPPAGMNSALALHVVETTEALYRSSREERRIDIPEV